MSCLICQIRFQIETLHLMMHKKRLRWRQFLNCDEDDRSAKYAGVPAASNREAALIPGPGGRGRNCESSEELSKGTGNTDPSVLLSFHYCWSNGRLREKNGLRSQGSWLWAHSRSGQHLRAWKNLKNSQHTWLHLSQRERKRECVCLYRCTIDFMPVRLFGK